MQQSFVKHITTFLFLFVFLLPRVVDLHALEYLYEDDDSVSCELCDIVSHTQQFNLFLDIAFYDDEQLLDTPIAFIVHRRYNSPLGKIATPASVYNKPPPNLLLG